VCLAVLLAAGAGRPRPDRHAFAQAVRSAEAIGMRLGHSTRAVYLSGDYGLPLEYHGYLSGWPWPLKSDLEWERLAGVDGPTAEARFRASYAPHGPEYFVVLDLEELAAQEDLARFLGSRFPVLAREADYVIYDLREP
jgi:hypothetical protein